MAISKPKNPNLIDDLVLNFDPFVANGLEEANASSATVQGAPESQVGSDDQPASSQVTGVAPPASDDAGSHDSPPVSLFKVELPGAPQGESSHGSHFGDPAFAVEIPDGDVPVPAGDPLVAHGWRVDTSTAAFRVNAESGSAATIVGEPEPAPPDPPPSPPRPVADPDFNEVAPEPPDPGPPPTVQEGAGSSSAPALAALQDWWLA
jgi:hypothetical protein